MQEKVKSAAFHAGCNWYADSDESSKYFLNLEKNKAGSKGMGCILKEDNTLEKHPQKFWTSYTNFIVSQQSGV